MKGDRQEGSQTAGAGGSRKEASGRRDEVQENDEQESTQAHGAIIDRDRDDHRKAEMAAANGQEPEASQARAHGEVWQDGI